MSDFSTIPLSFDLHHVQYKDQIEHVLRWAEVGTWEWSPIDEIFRVSPGFFTKYGFTEDDVAVNTWGKFIHPEDQDRAFTQFAEMISRQRDVFDCIYRIIANDGSIVYIHAHGGVLEYTDEGTLLRVGGTIQDISKFHQIEQAVLRRDRLLETANESAKILLSSNSVNFDLAIWKVLDLLGRVTEVDRVYIWKNRRGEDKRLYTTQIYEWSLGAKPQQGNEFTVDIAFEEAVPAWEATLTADRCINNLVRNMSQTEQDHLLPQGIISILVAPIMVDGEFWGFIGFDDCHQERLWSYPEEGVLKSAGRLIATAIMREKTTKALENERLFFQKMFEISPVSTAIFNVNGILLAANSQFYEMSRLKTGDSILPEFIHLKDRVAIMEAIATDGVINNYNFQAYNARGARFDVLFTALKIKHEGKPALLTWFVDITDLKRTEKELKQARDLAESATRAKSEFLAKMSHEIRTPMNAVLGLAYLCLQTELSSVQQDYLTKIQTAAANLLGIIDDILDFSKIEAGKMELEQIPFLPAQTIHETTVLLEQTVKEKGLELIVQLQDIGHDFLLGDPLRLRQVLTNLLNNAIKFTEKGSVTIAIHPVMVDQNFVTLDFSVKDTGIGMTPKQLQRLFLSFSQADGSTTRRYGGTGLGLAITKNLVELMGGTIKVKSVPGQGTTFHFQLQFPISGEVESGEKYALLSKKRVLVVDDDHTALKMIKSFLLSLDMRVDTVDSGFAAISTLIQAIQQDDPYQIVLLDWKMPRMDGLETIRRIRESQEIANVPQILMVTAYDRNECLRQAKGLGLAGFVVKPVTYSSLRDSITNTLMSLSPVKSDQVKLKIHEEDHVIGAHILLVEDNKVNQMVALGLLKLFGAEVSVVDNGLKAIEAVSLQDFDLVLMDIQMPVMDGLVATRAIRLLDKPGVDKLPIVAMTANALDIDYQRSLDAGMNDHLTKPIDPDKLHQALKSWIVPRY